LFAVTKELKREPTSSGVKKLAVRTNKKDELCVVSLECPLGGMEARGENTGLPHKSNI